MDIIQKFIYFSGGLQVIFNQLIQVYCFAYGILNLITMLIHFTNFVYADFLMNTKVFGIFGLVFFGALKQWFVYQEWMGYLNIILALFLTVYFYDGVCNITQNLKSRENNQKIGIGLIVINLILLAILFWLRINTKILKNLSEDQLTPPIDHNFVFIAFIIIFLIANLLRLDERTVFPFLIITLTLSLTLITKQILLRNMIATSLPLQSLIYIVLIIDSEGREFQKHQNKIIHSLFQSCLYFYGFLITNQRFFHAQYSIIIVCIIMMLLNK